MGLRLQDPIPEWITHIALVQGGQVKTGERATIVEELKSHVHDAGRPAAAVSARSEANILVDMRNVNVQYHERHVRSYPLLLPHGFDQFNTGLERYQLVHPRW